MEVKLMEGTLKDVVFKVPGACLRAGRKRKMNGLSFNGLL